MGQLWAKARRGYRCLEESPGPWQGRMQWEKWGKDRSGRHTLRVACEGRGGFWSDGGTVTKIAALSIRRWLWDLLWDWGNSRNVLPILFPAGRHAPRDRDNVLCAPWSTCWGGGNLTVAVVPLPIDNAPVRG